MKWQECNHATLTVCVRKIVTTGSYFQAEHGIRDLTVTGVQTCALPILQYRSPSQRKNPFRRCGCQCTPETQEIFWCGKKYRRGRQSHDYRDSFDRYWEQ